MKCTQIPIEKKKIPLKKLLLTFKIKNKIYGGSDTYAVAE